MSYGIIELKETSTDHWRARYQGNYGVYTITGRYLDGKLKDYSCSCPSDWYPCKHISMIEAAIAQHIKESDAANAGLDEKMSVAELLRDAPQKELYDFLVRQARYDEDLTSAIYLAFVRKTDETDKKNPFAAIIRNGLSKVRFYEDDYDHEDGLSVAILDIWLDKAASYTAEENYADALLIYKAALEEYADWAADFDSETLDDAIDYYMNKIFTGLGNLVKGPQPIVEELYNYCRSEMENEKYEDICEDAFHELLMDCSAQLFPAAYIALLDSQLEACENKASGKAHGIVQRKINFFRQHEQEEAAWQVIEEHIDIEEYRKQLTKKYMEEGKYSEARALIADFIAAKDKNEWHSRDWLKLRFDIAQKENDIPLIRDYSFEQIKQCFNAAYYQIYKATFNAADWPDQLETLLKLYQAAHAGFKESVAKLLAAEHAAERLKDYVAQYPTLEHLEQYYTAFASSFPAQTLTLFRSGIDTMLKLNTSRSRYEYAKTLMEKMWTIEGGPAVVSEMIQTYSTSYRTRKVMNETFRDFLRHVTQK
ncbi:hypothetical protein ACYULU_03110 [Breznakiellaceae bacterium SP9]